MLEELSRDLGIQVRLLAHQLREPAETALAIADIDGALGQAAPDLLRLRFTQPKLTVLQQKPENDKTGLGIFLLVLGLGLEN